MTELRRKFDNIKQSLSKQSLKSITSTDHVDVDDSVIKESLLSKVKKPDEGRTLPLNNPHREAEVVESIPKIYFGDCADFDATEHELTNMPQELDINEIIRDRRQMKEQLTVVSKKVSDLILENHPSYTAELARVQDLQTSLADARSVCTRSRAQIHQSQADFTAIAIRILAYYRKRQLLLGISRAIQAIKTLEETDFRLQELLQEANFCVAIQLCLECQKAAVTYQHYHCISELSEKLQNTLSNIEKSLFTALPNVCLNFDPQLYGQIFGGFQLLSKCQLAVDRLINEFTVTFQTTALSIVLQHLPDTPSTSDRSNLVKQVGFYGELCRRIPSSQFLLCMSDLCRTMWKILFNFHSLLQWHSEQSTVLDAQPRPVSPIPGGGDAVTASGDLNHSAVKEPLGSEMMRHLQDAQSQIWKECVNRVDIFLRNSDLTAFKFDTFLQVLSMANRIIEIGKKYFASDSLQLHETLKQQSLAYFKAYHRAKLEELRVFLEAEAWEICPVRQGFTLFSLQEFKFLKSHYDGAHFIPTTSIIQPSNGIPDSSSYSENQNNGFQCMLLVGLDNPFDGLTNGDKPETDEAFLGVDNDSGADSSDSDNLDEIRGDYIDEVTGKVCSNEIRPTFVRSQSFKRIDKMPPFLSNTALNVLRLFGKYLHMVSMLMPIAFDVVVCLSQLFEFYIYCVHYFFTSDVGDYKDMLTSSKLKDCLKNIEHSLVLSMQSKTEGKISVASLSSAVSLKYPDQLFALAERVIGAESAIYLAQQLLFLEPYLEQLISPSKQPFLQHFFTHTVQVVRDLRRPVYGSVAVKSLNYRMILTKVEQVNWKLNDIMSQHSSYVDFIIKDFDNFSLRLTEVSKRVPVPKECYTVLWTVAIQRVNQMLVEGYSTSSTCNSEGRALMQLDFRQLQMKLEKLIQLRPVPDKDYVDDYIKAFYLPEDQMEQWIQEKKCYTSRQLIGLVNVASHLSKRTKQRLILLLDGNGATSS